jgi:hypothetical protein
MAKKTPGNEGNPNAWGKKAELADRLIPELRGRHHPGHFLIIAWVFGFINQICGRINPEGWVD